MSISNKLIQAASGNAGSDNLYVEDVFTTFLYTGNDTDTNIVNGINLADEGGLVWIKSRQAAEGHRLIDSEWSLSANQYIDSSSTTAPFSGPVVNTFNTDGFQLDSNWYGNYSDPQYGGDFASWTFRKAEKFFDVVTWTGNGTGGRQIPHSLGSVPGFIITKRTDGADNWKSYHVGNPSPAEDHVIELDNTNAAGNESIWNDTAPTSINFTVSAGGAINANGYTYVAYLFASDAGGFGDDGSENIIKCGSYTGNGNIDGPTVTLGFEPQWLMIKGTGGGDWTIFDNMRGLAVGGNDSRIWANQSSDENNGYPYIDLQPTGFKLQGSTGGAANGNGSDYIYIAIRRPMKTPESGTEVFTPYAYSGNATADRILPATARTVDLGIVKSSSDGYEWLWDDRLRGANAHLSSNYSSGESTTSDLITGLDLQNGIEVGSWQTVNGSGKTQVTYMFTRAPGFMDVVAYTGDGASLSHNLGVVPEFIITKARGANGSWRVTSSATTGVLYIDANDAKNGTDSFQTLTPCTATTMNLSGISQNTTNISYLFATVAGVSKVGSYTGTGSNVDVDCGFSAGARFVLIKRTDSAGNWFIYDSARGIVAGADPYLRLNVSSAEDSSNDDIDPLSSGFSIPSGSNVNASGGTYIFLAIA